MSGMNLSFGRLLSIVSGLLLVCIQSAYAQEFRSISNKFKSEAGCPVDLVSAKTDLEIDPFGTPIACRIYIDYKNNSSKPISGVKFRIGYIDTEEKIRGVFHAPDAHVLEPGASAKAKWRGERIDPRTAYVMIRVLVARYSDGSEWDSEKLKDLAPGTGGSSSTNSDSFSGGAPPSSSSESAPSDTGSPKAGGSTGADAGEERSSGASAGAVGEPVTPAAEASSAPQSSGSDKSSDGY